MNIFVTDPDPTVSAEVLPDKHIVKMPLETCQMLSIVYSSHYWDIGQVMKVDGTPFKTARGAFKNHPCTQWAAAEPENCAWLIQHGCALADEFQTRYGKRHGLGRSLFNAKRLFHREVGRAIICYRNVSGFARAMPDDIKHDTSIDDVTAYRKYVNTKPWVYYNYLRLPDRRPDWITNPDVQDPN